MKTRFISLTLLITSVAFSNPSARAGTHVWSGASALNKNWSNPVNWSSGGVPAAGEDAPVILRFPASGAKTSIDTIPDLVVDQIVFESGDYVLSGSGVSGLTLRGSVSTNSIVGGLLENTIAASLPLVLNGAVTVDVAATQFLAGHLTISSDISGSGDLIKTGGGTLTFGGGAANTYSGTTVVRQGVLELGKQFFDGGVNSVPGPLMIGENSLFVTTPATVRLLLGDQISNLGAVSIFRTGTLDLENHIDVIGTLEMTAGNVEAGTGMLVLGGDVTIHADTLNTPSEIVGRLSLGSGSRVFDVAGGLHLEGQMLGNYGFTKTGAGTLHLHQLGSYSGITTINEGTIRIYHPSALGQSSAGTVVHAGAQLWVSVLSGGIVEELTLGGAGVNGGGALRATGTNVYQANLLLDGDAVIEVATNGFLTLNGAINGTGNLTFQGNGWVSLSGSFDNTYSGSTTSLVSRLYLDKLTNVGGAIAIPGPLVIGAPNAPYFSDEVYSIQPDQIVNNATVTVNYSGAWHVNDDDTVGGLILNAGHVDHNVPSTLTLGGDVTANTAQGHCIINCPVSLGGATRTFNVFADNSPQPSGYLYVQSEIRSGSGNAGLIKTGSSRLVLTATNIYAGLTVLQEGSLEVRKELNAMGTLGSAAAGTVVGTNAVLVLNGDVDLGLEPLTIHASAGGLSSVYVSGTNTSSGPITLNGDAPVYVAGRMTFGGAINGAGGLIKNGAGALILAGASANHYTGATRVQEGRLILWKNAAVTAIPGTLIVGRSNAPAGSAVVDWNAYHQVDDQAAVTLLDSGFLDARNETIGSLAGTGGVSIPSTTLTVGANNLDTVFSGAIIGPNGKLTKIGTGTFEISGTNSYSGETMVDNGNLLLTGEILPSPVTVNTSGTLLGTGRMKTLTCNGTVAPGNPLGGLTSSQDLQLGSQSTYKVELGGTQPGNFDSISVTSPGGTVNLNNANLAVSLGFNSAVSNQFVLVFNATGNPVAGTFKNLPEGAAIESGGAQFQITYQGGDGDDVVLTQMTEPAADFSPTLHILSLPAGQVRLSWPTNAIGFQVQSSATFASDSWVGVPEPLVVMGATNTVTLPATNGQAMFRLFKP